VREQAEGRARLAHLVEDSLADFDIRGLAVAITAHEVTTSLCRGALPSGEAIAMNTEMYAASLTKQLIGALVALAIAEGALAYEGRVTDYLANLPAWMAGLRVRHLLHHTSGIPELPTTPENWPTDNAAMLDALRATRLAPEPAGTRHSYSNAGYIILAEILAAAYGRSVADMAEKRLFAPLGMRQSRLGGPPRHMPGYADPPGTIGDGGWWTTINDLHIWLVALNDRRVPFDVRRIEGAGRLEDGTFVPYGWGLGLRDTDGQRTVTHGGGWEGWISMTRRLPDRGIAIALLTHSDDDRAVIELHERLTRGVLTLS
jgi:CubicO group peptidase (beta-lactamase class C family)